LPRAVSEFAQDHFLNDRWTSKKYDWLMSDLSKIHDEKYKSLRNAGMPGWGGASRIGNLPQVIEDRFLSLETLPRSGRLLEIGCGAGNISIELAKRGYEVTKIDFSETAIAWAKENAAYCKAEIDFLVGDVANLASIKTESFDIVFDGNCIHCLVGQKREAAFREFYRVLEPNGILFVSSLSASQANSNFPENFNAQSRVLLEDESPYRFIPTPEFLAAEVIQNGFSILKKFIRDGNPFGHSSIHAQKIGQ